MEKLLEAATADEERPLGFLDAAISDFRAKDFCSVDRLVTGELKQAV